MTRAPGLLLLLAGAAWAVPAGAAADRCAAVSLEAYATVPALFYEDRPDSLAGLLLRWDEACGPAEPIQRTRILAAVWDDAFDESLYDRTVIDDLARYGRRLEDGVDPEADDPRERYDAFTVSLADQLLPHTDRAGLEAFFCLFYSGRTDEAWRLLGSDALADTELARRYENELELLRVPQPAVTVAATGGAWLPGGDQAFVGDLPLAGVMVGLRSTDWLARLALEMRVGRADRPYTAEVRGLPRRSDRFHAVLAAVELGRVVRAGERLSFDFFGGLGADAVKPFRGEDLTLGGVNASLGAGCRVLLGREHGILGGIDVRREWVGERNPDGTPLGGTAWSVRAAVGVALDQGRGRRLRALTP